MLQTSNTWFTDDSDWYSGLVGRTSDTYRLMYRSGPAGMAAVLSPDGARLASPEGITDLATGALTPYPEQWRDLEPDIAAQAWSPDGTRLAVLTGADRC